MAAPGDPRFAQFDEAMTAFMQNQDVAAGQIAVMYDGHLLYTSGYGHTKEDGSGPTTAQAMFRLASVTKPMTHALIGLQVEQGLYNWTDPVFCLPPTPAPNCRIPLDPDPKFPVVDPRIAHITVEDLALHKGGWGRSTDYLYRAEGTKKIHEALGTTGAPTRWQGAQYLMGIPLPTEPGTDVEYCNVCYMLLTLVAEAATGADIGALFDAYLFRPLQVSGDIELGKAFPRDRNQREPFYQSSPGPSAYDPDKTVPLADGGWNIEILAGTGGLIATSAAVAAVYEAYPDYIPPDAMVSPNPYQQTHDLRAHSGLLDGTLTYSAWALDKSGRAGPVQVVYLFNNGAPSQSCGDYDAPLLGHIVLSGCAPTALKATLVDLAIAKAEQEAVA